MENALIIFVRNLTYGKVKTRLAATVGHEEAFRIYEYLLDYTYSVASQVTADPLIFYSDYIDEQDSHPFSRNLQSGADLGERMNAAFEYVFDRGYRKAVIIGSDSAEIEPGVIEEAYLLLDTNDIVIGPATDGGYYLLGMKERRPELFQRMTWSVSSVAEETIRRIKEGKLSFQKLKELGDIDTEADWLAFRQERGR